ncbi:MAG: hypothetical protein AAB112_09405, partial [Thermodesulfobacteriota bacterium]
MIDYLTVPGAPLSDDQSRRLHLLSIIYDYSNFAISFERGAVYEPGHEKSILIRITYIEDSWPSQWKIASPKTRQT